MDTLQEREKDARQRAFNALMAIMLEHGVWHLRDIASAVEDQQLAVYQTNPGLTVEDAVMAVDSRITPMMAAILADLLCGQGFVIQGKTENAVSQYLVKDIFHQLTLQAREDRDPHLYEALRRLGGWGLTTLDDIYIQIEKAYLRFLRGELPLNDRTLSWTLAASSMISAFELTEEQAAALVKLMEGLGYFRVKLSGYTLLAVDCSPRFLSDSKYRIGNENRVFDRINALMMWADNAGLPVFETNTRAIGRLNLYDLRSTTFVLFGFYGDNGVMRAAVELAKRGFSVVVLEDLCLWDENGYEFPGESEYKVRRAVSADIFPDCPDIAWQKDNILTYSWV